MNRAAELLRRIAPTASPDPVGLERARASFERSRREVGTGPAGRLGLATDHARRPPVTAGRLLALVTAGALFLGALGTAAVLVGDQRGLDRAPLPAGTGTTPGGTPVPPHDGAADRWSDDGCDPRARSTDTGRTVPVDEWPEKLDHAVKLQGLAIEARPTLQEIEVRCLGRVARAVFVDVDGNRGFTVYRNQRPYTPPSAASGEDSTEAEGWPQLELRGTTGAFSEQPQLDVVTVMWEEQGTSWTARTTGLTVDEVRTVVDALRISPDGEVSGPVPDGFEAVVPEAAPADTARLFRLHDAAHGPYLYVSWPVVNPAAAFLARSGGEARAVRMPDGSLAVYEPSSVNPPRFHWQKNGVVYSLTDAGATLPEMIERAEHIEHLEATDPRLTATGLADTTW